MPIDEIITLLRAEAFLRGVHALAEEAEMSDDQLRRILSNDPPGWLEKFKRLEEMALALKASKKP